MKIKDLSSQEWDLLEQKLSNMVPDWSVYDKLVLVAVRSNGKKEPRPKRYGLLYNHIEKALLVPFKDIPTLMGTDSKVSKAIYAFRLEVGV